MKRKRTTTKQNVRRVAILGFHKIGEPPAGESPTWFYISKSIFEGFLRWLKANAWQVIDCETFLRGLEFPEILPERAALITFDDGYRSMRDVALPVLRTHNVPSVLFVPVGYVGTTNQFDAGIEPLEPMCDWQDLQDLICGGVSIQSHGNIHARFSLLDERQLRDEIEQSKSAIESRTVGSVKLFSFPYGDSGRNPQKTSDILRNAGYSAAFIFGGGTITMPPKNRFLLERVAMGPNTDLTTLLGGL